MRYVVYGWFPWGQSPQVSDAVDTYAPIFLRKLGTVPAGLADIYDLYKIFVCFDDLRLPWGQSPQVSQCAARMAGLPGGGRGGGVVLAAAARRDASPHHAVATGRDPPTTRHAGRVTGHSIGATLPVKTFKGSFDPGALVRWLDMTLPPTPSHL